MVRQGHQVQIPGDVVGDHIGGGGFWIGFQLLVGQKRHGNHTFRQRLAALGVVKLAVIAQNQAVVLGIGDHLRGPDHTAPCIITAQNGHDHAIVSAHIFKGAEYAGGDVDDVALLGKDFSCRAPAAPEKPPAAFEHKEHLGSAVAVQAVAAAWGLACGPDVKAGGLADMHVLIGAFRHAATDDGEVLFAVRSGGMGVDKGGLAGAQLAIADDAGLHLLRGHSSPVCIRICFQIAVSSIWT